MNQKEFVSRAFKGGRWISFPLGLAHEIGIPAAYLLSYLINRTRVEWKYLEAGWLPVSCKELEMNLAIGRWRQFRLLSELAGHGLIWARNTPGAIVGRTVKLRRSKIIHCLEKHTPRPKEVSRLILGSRRCSSATLKTFDTLQNCNIRRRRSSLPDVAELQHRPAMKTPSKEESKKEEEKTTLSRNAGALLDRGENLISADAEFDLIRAKKLHGRLGKARQLWRRVNLTAWARWFGKLRQEGADSQRINLVLEWYVGHLKDPFVPQAHSAEAFYRKFLQIETAMTRARARPAEQQTYLPLTIMSKSTRVALRSIERLDWPAQLDRYGLHHSVQQSCIQYRNWMHARARWLESRPKGELRALDRHLQLCGFITDRTSEFVEYWYEQQHTMVKDWENWSGNPDRLTFRPDKPAFQKAGARLNKEFSGDSVLWHDYLAGIAKHFK